MSRQPASQLIKRASETVQVTVCRRCQSPVYTAVCDGLTRHLDTQPLDPTAEAWAIAAGLATFELRGFLRKYLKYRFPPRLIRYGFASDYPVLAEHQCEGAR